MIAEDDPVVGKILKRIFTRQNYSVLYARDGRKAYHELKTNLYDVCILDLGLPLMSGIKILKKIDKNKEITTSIIVFTACDDKKTIITVMKLGAHNYIQKPFESGKFKMAVEKAYQQRRIKMENIKYKCYLEREIESKIKVNKQAYLDIISAFASSIEMRDPYTGGHSRRVSKIAYMIGKEMNLSDPTLEDLRIGGILHDIGKIGISDNILKKTDKLTKEEFNEIAEHPKIGYILIKQISSLKSVLPCILFHQERYDGTGYPQGLKGKDIPMEGRIMAMADAFEAMTSDRPYRKALSYDMAYKEIITNAGKQFDPDIVKIFVKLWNTQKIKKICRN